MYSREIHEPPKKLIKDGKPLFGTYSPLPKIMDIRGVKRPFANLPVLPFFTNMRIRCSVSTLVQTDDFIIYFSILDVRFFSYTEVIFWNKKTGKKYPFRRITGIRNRVVPKNLEKATAIIRSKKRYVRIKWDKSKNHFSIVFNMNGDKLRPDISGSFVAQFTAPYHAEALCVMPSPGKSRCTALVQSTYPVEGTLFENRRDGTILPFDLEGQMAFSIRRAYTKLRTQKETLCACGILNGKQIYFHFTSAQNNSVEPDVYNENLLIVDGQITPLPGVKITHPYGLNKQWIIQDTESMVDLSFTPVSDNLRNFSIFIVHAKLHTMYGTFSGNLLDKNGKSISLKDFSGIAKAQRIRF